MWISVIVALLFLAGAVYNLIIGDYDNAIAGLVIAGAIAGVAAFFRWERRKSTEFIEWAIANRQALSQGPVVFQGKQVGMDTQLVRFWACLSFLLVTTRAPSRFLVNGYDNTFLLGSIYTLVSLIAGWWGIPWGPIFTVQTVVRNLRGGERITVADLLEPGSEVRVPPGGKSQVDHIVPR